MWITLGCVSVLFFLEIMMAVAEGVAGGAGDWAQRVINDAVYPFLFRLAVLGTAQWIAFRNKRCIENQDACTFVYITAVTVICLSVALVHRDVPVGSGIFYLPILVTLLYSNSRLQRYSFLLNLTCYAIYVLVLALFPHAVCPNVASIAWTLLLLCASYWLSQLVINHQMHLIEQAAHADRRSRMDSLTQLYNHASFYEQLDEHIIRNHNEGQSFCLIVFDIDDFKRVNDVYLHHVGDIVLLKLVEAINASLCGSDMAFRYGGEEFTVLTDRDTQGSVLLAEAVRAGFVARLKTMEAPVVEVTVSAGICAYDPELFTGRREFFAAADEALYEAKRTGKDRVVLWTPQLLERP